MWSWWRAFRGRRTDDAGQKKIDGGAPPPPSSVVSRARSVSPAVAPHLFADGAGHARWASLHRHHAPFRHEARDLEHELGAGRLLELVALADRDHERAGAADDAILVVDVEVVDIHGEGVRPLEHDRQAVDGDARGEHVVAHERDERTAVVGAVAGNVDHPAKAAKAATVEQWLAEIERARN